MIHSIDRFGEAWHDFGGIVHNITLPELRSELDKWISDKIMISTRECYKPGWYHTNIYVGPCHTWKYRIIHNEMSDISFLEVMSDYT